MTMERSQEHIPVMLNEVIENLMPQRGGTYVDCTFGAGGYSKAILEKEPAALYAFDQDPEVVPFANALAEKINAQSTQFHFIRNNFANLKEILNARGVYEVNGIVLDLGVSSMQLDRQERGFSFQKEGRLDMRMSNTGYSAYECINEVDERALANIIYLYGDEKNSRKIARSIIAHRQKAPIETTLQLAAIVREACGQKDWQLHKIDAATKTFQAIRIYVNNELESLEAVLAAAEDLLKEHGRLVVVSFHSLEDRIVKKFLTNRVASSGNQESRYFVSETVKDATKASFKLLTKKAQMPSREEIKKNVRSRSAKLRSAERINRGSSND